MSSQPADAPRVLHWRDGALEPAGGSAGGRAEPGGGPAGGPASGPADGPGDEPGPAPGIAVADSWLVRDGRALAIGVHRERFLRHAGSAGLPAADGEAFWDAAIDRIPREGDWFPRVELRGDGGLLLRLRRAPGRGRSLRVVTHRGADPRSAPGTKGPDLDGLGSLREAARERGADDLVILDAGCVAETTTSALMWWRGEAVCVPPDGMERIESVTERVVLTLATALGLEVHREAVAPHELDGLELWALNALHGARIVTGWAEGPRLAEDPGRLEAWRRRLEALRKPLPPIVFREAD